MSFDRTSVIAALTLVSVPVLISYAPAVAQDTEAAQDAADDEKTAREEGGRQCFYARQVTGFRNVDDDDDKILVDVRSSDTFEFQLMRRCPELRFARGISFKTRGSGRICDGLDVDLLVPDPNLGPQSCPVTMIRKLDPGEEGARAGAKD